MALDNNKKIIIGVVSALVLSATIYLLLRKRRDKPRNGESLLLPSGESDTSYVFTFPIRKGQKGENVKKLQQLILSINPNALPKYKDDGDFGNETASALLKMIGKESIDNQADLNKLKTPLGTNSANVNTGSTNQKIDFSKCLDYTCYKMNPSDPLGSYYNPYVIFIGAFNSEQYFTNPKGVKYNFEDNKHEGYYIYNRNLGSWSASKQTNPKIVFQSFPAEPFTNVYESPSTNSKVLTTTKQGDIGNLIHKAGIPNEYKKYDKKYKKKITWYLVKVGNIVGWQNVENWLYAD